MGRNTDLLRQAICRARLDDGNHKVSRSLGRCLVTLALGPVFSSTTAMAATYQVNTTGDPGPPGTMSLRQAVSLAASTQGSIVSFASSLVGSTITLDHGILLGTALPPFDGYLNYDFTILGRGSDAIKISNGYLAMTGHDPHTVTISGLTLAHAKDSVGILSRGMNLVLEDVTLADFTASSQFEGGGIFVDGASLSVSDSHITGNQTTSIGGGIYMVAGNLTVQHTTISGNLAMGFNGQLGSGGGIAMTCCSSNTLLVQDSTIAGNAVNGYGGGIFVASVGSVQIERSLISGNSISPPGSAYDYQGGGGILANNIATDLTVLNSTITGNSTYSTGGGIRLFDAATAAKTKIWFSTITNNYASAGGNGIFTVGTAAIDSSIVANNSTRVSDRDLGGSFVVTYSLVKNPASATISGGGNIFGQDPLLGPLSDNGGPTLTMLPASNSPVINFGSAIRPQITVDQRGLIRPPGQKDSGAVERQFPEDRIFANGFDSS